MPDPITPGMGSLIGAGASLLGAGMESSAASSAANTQSAATRAAVAENARQYDLNRLTEQQRYDQNRTDRSPYMATGRTALAQYLREMGLPGVRSNYGGTTGTPVNTDALRSQLLPQYTSTKSVPGQMLMSPVMGEGNVATGAWESVPGPATQQSSVDEAGLNAAIARMSGQGSSDLPNMEDIQTTAPQDVQLDPGYQFGLNQGQMAIDRRNAASGGRISGAALKGAAEYATNYATTGYNNAYQRRQDRLNRLQTLAGYGTTPYNQGTGQQPNNGNAALISSQGNAAGAAQLAQGNIWGNAVNKLGAAAKDWTTQTPSVTVPTTPFNNYGGDYNSLNYANFQ
jgi:hypothetical protein